MVRVVWFWILFICCGFVHGDSLWQDGFQGYISGSTAFRAGDIITVLIDSGLSLDFTSTAKDSKSITFEFAGGEYAGLFSFLPAARTGDDRSVSGREKYSLKTELSARVIEIDPTGKLVLEGSRSVQLEGKLETIVLTGRADPKSVDSGRSINFRDMENARLAFSSFLRPQADTLSERDIQEIVKEIEAGEGGQKTQQITIDLTSQKKRELILQYLNRLVDIIFR